MAQHYDYTEISACRAILLDGDTVHIGSQTWRICHDGDGWSLRQGWKPHSYVAAIQDLGTFVDRIIYLGESLDIHAEAKRAMGGRYGQ